MVKVYGIGPSALCCALCLMSCGRADQPTGGGGPPLLAEVTVKAEQECVYQSCPAGCC